MSSPQLNSIRSTLTTILTASLSTSLAAAFLLQLPPKPLVRLHALCMSLARRALRVFGRCVRVANLFIFLHGLCTGAGSLLLAWKLIGLFSGGDGGEGGGEAEGGSEKGGKWECEWGW